MITKITMNTAMGFGVALFIATTQVEARPQIGVGVAIGGLWHNLGHLTATADDGRESALGTLTPVGQLHVALRGETFSIQPTLILGLTGNTLADESLTHRLWGIGLQTGVRPWTFPLDLKLGVGNLFHRYQGAGGSLILDNGNTKTEFALPERTVHARLWFMSLGVALTHPSLTALRTELDFLILQLGNSERRGVDVLFSIGWAGLW